MEGAAVVFDAYAWVEYALDSPRAPVVARLLEEAAEAYTPASVLAELKESMLRRALDPGVMDQVLTFIRSRTTVVGIDGPLAEAAGEINFAEKKAARDWGMLDSFVYAVARAKGAKVLTGDPHFKRLDDVIYIGP